MSDQINSIRNNLTEVFRTHTMPGGWQFNHAETLRRINLYSASKYESGQYDDQGFYKFFYNISKVPVDIARKFVDLDTKDVILNPTAPSHEFRVWVMQRRLAQWMKDNGFATLLNDIRDDYPKYGSVVIKRAKGKWHKVQLENLRMDPTVKSLDRSPFVHEATLMHKGEIEQMKWNNVQELFRKHPEDQDGKFWIYDCYTKVGQRWKHQVLGGLFTPMETDKQTTESYINDEEQFLPPVVLHETTISKLPYRELHFERVPGRWLGMGFVELLFDAQVATNEAENLERKGLIFTSLHLWQTRDDSIGGANLLTRAQNGDIVQIDQEIQPIAMEERNLPAYNATRNRWEVQAERLSFSNDIVRGENLPSRTPLGVAEFQFGAVSSFFEELRRETFGIFIKDLVVEDIIPAFKNDTAEEHIMTFLGSDEEIQKLDSAISRALVNEKIVEHANETGFYPSKEAIEEMRALVEEKLARTTNRYLKVPRGFYEKPQYFVDIITTGESIDVSARSQILQVGLQIIGTNPGILQNKTTRTIFFKFLSLGGISPVEIGLLTEEIDETPVQPGGSVAAPQQGRPQVGQQPAQV